MLFFGVPTCVAYAESHLPTSTGRDIDLLYQSHLLHHFLGLTVALSPSLSRSSSRSRIPRIRFLEHRSAEYWHQVKAETGNV